MSVIVAQNVTLGLQQKAKVSKTTKDFKLSWWSEQDSLRLRAIPRFYLSFPLIRSLWPKPQQQLAPSEECYPGVTLGNQLSDLTLPHTFKNQKVFTSICAYGLALSISTGRINERT